MFFYQFYLILIYFLFYFFTLGSESPEGQKQRLKQSWLEVVTHSDRCLSQSSPAVKWSWNAAAWQKGVGTKRGLGVISPPVHSAMRRPKAEMESAVDVSTPLVFWKAMAWSKYLFGKPAYLLPFEGAARSATGPGV
jgi:hypothetical protein